MHSGKSLVEVELLAEVVGMRRIALRVVNIAIREIEHRAVSTGRSKGVHPVADIVGVLAAQQLVLVFSILVLERGGVFQPVGELERQACIRAVAEVPVAPDVHADFVQRGYVEIVQAIGVQLVQVGLTVTVLFGVGVADTAFVHQGVVGHVSIARREEIESLGVAQAIVNVRAHVKSQPRCEFRRVLEVDADGTVVGILVFQLIARIGKRSVERIALAALPDVQGVLLGEGIALAVFLHILVVAVAL